MYGRQFGFPRGLLSTITLLDVDAVVREGKSLVATLDLAKAYDKVNRNILLQDCKLALCDPLTDMIQACLQALNVTKKRDVMGKEVTVKLSLTQGSPLSALLFLIYINDISHRRKTDRAVVQNRMGDAEISLTADVVIVNTENWPAMQVWVDA